MYNVLASEIGFIECIIIKKENALAIIISLQTDFLVRSRGLYGVNAHLGRRGVLAGGESLL